MTDNAVKLERMVRVPVDLVWRMWTEPEHFSAWYGPDGASLPVVEMDVRVGGRRFIAMEMETPNGPMRMWFVGEYREIVEYERLVYTESLSDDNGTVLSGAEAGLPDGHPSETVVTVEFAGVPDGTHITLTHTGVPADSPGATGWIMALDKLTARLEAFADEGSEA